MSTNNKGILVIISGFSGAGKGTLVHELMTRYENEYALSISATTRNPRFGEQEGVHYFYKSRQEFEDMISQDAFLEYAQYVNNYYGTPKQYVLDRMEEGKNVLLEIEMQGAMKVKKNFPDTQLIFVSAPSAAELYNRLAGRGTEEPEVIAKRMQRAYEEAQDMDRYEYLLINDNLDESVTLLHEIITNEKNHETAKNEPYLMQNHIPFVDNMRKELKSFLKGE
ncbi:MAG: guanylate kinase [Agathobacter sp.]|nr:guanylate kinase [Agathobacter sp.]